MLADILPAEAFGFILILVRISAMVVLIPTVGEVQIPPRARIAFAIVLSLVIYPLERAGLPAMPGSVLALAGIVIGEVLIGAMVGAAARLLVSALHVAGTVIGFQSGLAAAQQFDPTQGAQSAIVAGFLTMFGTVILFAANMHHLVIAAMRGSYTMFPPAAVPNIGDFAMYVTQSVNAAFNLGIRLAAPVMVYAIVYNVGLGMIARLMPQLPVFFIGMPLNIFLGFFILMASMAAIGMVFISFFEDRILYLMP